MPLCHLPPTSQGAFASKDLQVQQFSSSPTPGFGHHISVLFQSHVVGVEKGRNFTFIVEDSCVRQSARRAFKELFSVLRSRF